MDSHKPLTVTEIEELGRLHGIVTQDRIEFPNRSPHYYEYFCRMMFDALPRLLSLLTPPPDAAVREAVEEISQELALPPCWCEGSCADELDGAGPCYFEVEEKHLRTIILRAGQAQLLTEEQREAIVAAQHMLEMSGLHGGVRLLRAAFPEAFAGEVGRG